MWSLIEKLDAELAKRFSSRALTAATICLTSTLATLTFLVVADPFHLSSPPAPTHVLAGCYFPVE